MLTCLCGRQFNGEALARCPACKTPTSDVRSITPEQREERRRKKQQAVRDEEELRRLSAEEREQMLLARKVSYITAAIDRMEVSLAEGRAPALHTTVLMNSDYSLNGQIGGASPDATAWSMFGWDGWEIVTSFPHTTGISLQNRVGSNVSYGGGVGGLIDGVYLVLRFPITAHLLHQRRPLVEHMLAEIYERELAGGMDAVTPTIPQGQESSPAGSQTAAAATAGGAVLGYGMIYTQSMQSDDDGSGDDIADGGDGGGFLGDFDF